MNNEIPQLEYEKLSDDLYYMGDYVLKFCVDLARKDKDNKRVHFHKEFRYDTNKYINCNKLVTLKRSFDFYLVLERYRNNDSYEKHYIQIRVQNMIYLKIALEEAQDWFFDNRYRNLFAYDKDRKLIMMSDLVDKVSIKLPMDRYMILEPIVFVNYEGQEERGVRMTLGDGDKYIDMSIEKFLGFKYLIENLNMYESAQILINYIPQIPCGTNSYEFADTREPSREGEVSTNVTAREVPCKKDNVSFFSMMDNL